LGNAKCRLTFNRTLEPRGLKPLNSERLYGTTKEAAEKHLFCALRFATRKPAAARNCDFACTYGTAKAVPFRKIMLKPSFAATSEIVP
jgi:hypothetical protein